MFNKRILWVLCAVLILPVMAIYADDADYEHGFYFNYPEGEIEVICSAEGLYAPFIEYVNGQVHSSRFNDGDRGNIRLKVTKLSDNSVIHEVAFWMNYSKQPFSETTATGFGIYNLTDTIDYGYKYVSELLLYSADETPLSLTRGTIICPNADGPGTGFIENISFIDSDDDIPVLTVPALSDSKTIVEPTNTEEGLAFILWDATQTGRTFRITAEQISAVSPTPQENTLIAQFEDGYYRFYRLTTGHLQLNIGPDFEGKEFVTVFSAGGQVVKTYTIDPQ